jgi:hypothetical protein
MIWRIDPNASGDAVGNTLFWEDSQRDAIDLTPRVRIDDHAAVPQV